ncbi:hypothetical protein FRB97_002700 [Tulasnella sp. 331]|nr:hypothetical protein FRB97_002700 [Tulasnella sp. 331]
MVAPVASGSSPPPPTASPARPKLTGWELYRDVMRSPKHIVAPMVDQSELAWRVLSRRYGGHVCYTPMINAKIYSDPRHQGAYCEGAFNLACDEEGNPTVDRPLVIQFAANDPSALLESAKALQHKCDAVDINFGCPQDIARRGRYGAYLCEDWDLVYKLINVLHVNLDIPVTAKFRIFSDVDKTVKYAKMMESAGAQILTCHGRTREQRGHKSGLADWSQIAAVKRAVSVPVFANGSVLYPDDVQKCLDFTGADAYMSAEPQLHNPALFFDPSSSSLSPPHTPAHPRILLSPQQSSLYPFHADLALEYLSIVSALKTPTTPSAVKAHLFKIMFPALPRETDLRNQLGVASMRLNGVEVYVEICKEMKERMDRDISAAGWDPSSPGAYDFPVDSVTGLKTIPHWLVQPNVRPPKPEPKLEGPNLSARLAKSKAAASASASASVNTQTPTIPVPNGNPVVPTPEIGTASTLPAAAVTLDTLRVAPHSEAIAISSVDTMEEVACSAQAGATEPVIGDKRRSCGIASAEDASGGLLGGERIEEGSKRARFTVSLTGPS